MIKITKQKYSMNYRSDLDGLRCIAVFIVMLFHAKNTIFCGIGFIGVDLFIVISGYLISGIIINNILNDTFSLKNFYLRRICFPALFVMMLLLALFYLFTDQSHFERETLIESIFSAAFMFTNFIAWKHVGYLTQGIELMPLIHTWSLSPQFYLVFPIFVFITFRNKSVNKFIYLIFILTLLSFS